MVEPDEPCPGCDRPMTVTGRNVILGGVNVGTTWQCRNPDCISGVLGLSGPWGIIATRGKGIVLRKAREKEED